jgi:hypothetical protein
VSNYVKNTDYAVKDGLLSGNPNKIIKGTELDEEFNDIATAISTKANLVSPTFTGTPTAPTASPGTNTTQVATTAFVGAAVTAATGSLGTMSTQDANNVSITGGSITGITDLAVADGGTGRSTLTANNVLLGNGTSAINFVAPGTSGNVLTSNGTTWASAAIPAQSTAQVLNATAGASANDVGTYAFLSRITTGALSFGTNYSGSDLRPIGLRMDNNNPTAVAYTGGEGSARSGTWKCMGETTSSSRCYTLFLRVA